MSSTAPASSYRLARGYAVRLLGMTAVATGGAVIGYAVVSASSAPGWLWGALLSLAVLLGLVTLVGALLTARPIELVRFDETGFRVRWLRGGQVGSGRWRDVEDVAGGVHAGQRVAVLNHRDGNTTMLPLALLDTPGDDVEADVQRRLNAAYGYQRVNLS